MIKSHYSALITCCACECKRDADSGGLKSKPLSFHTRSHTHTHSTRALSAYTHSPALSHLTYYSPSLTHSRERTSRSTLNCGRLATQRLMSNKCNLFMASTLPPARSRPLSLFLSRCPQNASSFQHNYHKHTHVCVRAGELLCMCVNRWPL